MNEQRDTEFGGDGKCRPEDRMIHAFFLRPGHTEWLLYTEVLYASLQFPRSGISVGGWQHRQCLEAGWMGRDDLGEHVVRTTREIDAVITEIAETGRRKRQHLHIDPGLIHERQPLFADIGKAFFDHATVQR